MTLCCCLSSQEDTTRSFCLLHPAFPAWGRSELLWWLQGTLMGHQPWKTSRISEERSGERPRADRGLEEPSRPALRGSNTLELKCFCGSCRKFLEVRKCPTKIALVFNSVLLLQCGLCQVTGCVFQGRCRVKGAHW